MLPRHTKLDHSQIVCVIAGADWQTIKGIHCAIVGIRIAIEDVGFLTTIKSTFVRAIVEAGIRHEDDWVLSEYQVANGQKENE